MGTSSGLGSWILANLGVIQSVASMVGAVFGALVAIGTFLLMLPKIWRFVRSKGRQVWKCRRCGELVDMENRRCSCSVSPSPWEPFDGDELP